MSNPRNSNGHRRRKLREYFKNLGLPCAICGRPIDYDLPAFFYASGGTNNNTGGSESIWGGNNNMGGSESTWGGKETSPTTDRSGGAKGKRIYNDWAFELDEIIPCSLAESYGYSSKKAACLDVENLQPVHRICNRLKSNHYIGSGPNLSNRLNNGNREGTESEKKALSDMKAFADMLLNN